MKHIFNPHIGTLDTGMEREDLPPSRRITAMMLERAEPKAHCATCNILTDFLLQYGDFLSWRRCRTHMEGKEKALLRDIQRAKDADRVGIEISQDSFGLEESAQFGR